MHFSKVGGAYDIAIIYDEELAKKKVHSNSLSRTSSFHTRQFKGALPLLPSGLIER